MSQIRPVWVAQGPQGSGETTVWQDGHPPGLPWTPGAQARGRHALVQPQPNQLKIWRIHDQVRLVLIKSSSCFLLGPTLFWFEQVLMCVFCNIFPGIKSMKKRSLKRWKPSIYFIRREPPKWETPFSTMLHAGKGFKTHCIFKEIGQIIATG